MKTKFWIICLSVFFVSCLRNMHDIYTGGEEEEEEKINKDDFFDFTTVRNSQLIIDYGMKVQTAFYLYDEYPMELVGNTWEFKDINPIYAASTDMNGRFSAKNRHKAQRKAKFYINKCRSASCMQSGRKRTPA